MGISRVALVKISKWKASPGISGYLSLHFWRIVENLFQAFTKPNDSVRTQKEAGLSQY
jgi:hypothetical protein